MRYLITFACYGAHLHGDESGSVDPQHNVYGTRSVAPNPKRATAERLRMDQSLYGLDSGRRAVVLEAIKEVCRFRNWILLAAHVRSNHVHIVVEAEVSPEKVLNDCKVYASRALNQLGRDAPGRKRWARHGSTRWLWDDQNVRQAVTYVLDEQGDAMAVFMGDAP